MLTRSTSRLSAWFGSSANPLLDDDKLCEPGFSKDGKSKENQIVVGLLVSAGGYPLAYSVFCGSQYEGFTMIPLVEDFVRRFRLDTVAREEGGCLP